MHEQQLHDTERPDDTHQDGRQRPDRCEIRPEHEEQQHIDQYDDAQLDPVELPVDHIGDVRELGGGSEDP